MPWWSWLCIGFAVVLGGVLGAYLTALYLSKGIR